MLKTTAKPVRCPWCNSNLVAEIIHEINSLTPAVEQDLNDRKAVLGLSLQGLEDPKWQCMDCGAQIYGHDRAGHPGREHLAFASKPGEMLPTDLKTVKHGN